jgi:hypothetical protein
MRSILRLTLLAIALAGAWRLWQRHGELMAVKDDLDERRLGIEETETELDALDRSIDDSEARLAALEARIVSIERMHPAGIPPSIHADYARLVSEHNEVAADHNALVARHRDLRGTYRDRVDRHNARVEEANSEVARGPLCALLPERLRPTACPGGRDGGPSSGRD